MRCALALVAMATVASAAGSGDVATPRNLNQWGAITLFHGLPSDHVRAIAQDSDGVMWFGTDGGLARYDGRRTQTVSGAAVRTIAADSSGRLWVGTDSGAGLLVDGALQAVPGVGSHAITGITRARDGSMILVSAQGEIFEATWSNGGEPRVMLRADGETSMTLSTATGLLPLTSVVATNDGLLVGSLGRGLLAVDRDFAVAEVASRPRSFFVQCLTLDPSGHAFFGAVAHADDGGVFDASQPTRPARLGGAGTVNALAFDAFGDLWVATDDRGTMHFRGSSESEGFTFEGTAGGLRSNRVYAVFVDREGVVWFGTDRGVSRYDPQSARVEPLGGNPDANFVRSLLCDASGRIWCGTNRGLFVSESADAWTPVAGMEGRVVYALAQSPAGEILVGTGSSLFAISANGGTPVQVRGDLGGGDGIRAIRSFRGQIFVAVFGRGVARLDGGALEYVWPDESADVSSRSVVSLSTDGDGKMIVGTASAGAFQFDGASWQADAALASSSAGAVWDIARGSDGTLWIASSRGLFAVRGAESQKVSTDIDTRAVVVWGANAWCATQGGGVLAFALGEEGQIVSARLDAEHGLPSNAVFALATDRQGGRSRLVVGTSRGVVRYEPGTVAPAVRISRVFGVRAYEPSEIARGLSLEYPQNGLSVEAAATSSRTFPEQFQYAFTVVDADGRVVTRRVSHETQLTLDGLKPGRYRIEARAFSNDLVESEPVGVFFEVQRAPFPWGVTALSGLLALALVALWWGGVQNRRLAGANRELRDTRLQLARETETERRRIARDLHDQTLADLRRLLLVADAEHAGGPLRSEIEAISMEIRRICEDLSPSVLANVGLTAALEWAVSDAVAHVPDARRPEYAFECDDGIESRLELDATQRIQLYRIVQEAITNACRHAGGSRLRLAIHLDGGVLSIALDDDGVGFEDTGPSGSRGRGLVNMRSRASMIGADVRWSKLRDGGTRFLLTVAARNDASPTGPDDEPSAAR